MFWSRRPCGTPSSPARIWKTSRPSRRNFVSSARFLKSTDANELAGAVAKLIDNPEVREELGARAAALAAAKRGATRKAVSEILRRQDLAVPRWSQLSPARFLLWPLAKIWAAVSARQQRRKMANARRLATPVVSIGGISMGGAGKTPMVDHLAERLSEAGYHPAILTRGYRRRSIETSILVEAGEPAPVSFTGDEAQIFVQSGYAHAGIGADRFVTGRLLEERYRPDVFLLDDGFQHTRLRRDLDLVVIDALNPFGGGAVFPLGNLREPISALARAGVFVIMRAAPEREYAGIVRQLRAHQPACADISRASGASLLGELRDTPAAAIAGGPSPAAFCGLANPASFWGTLRCLRLQPVFHWAFGDHHHYTCAQVERLAAQAKMHGSNLLLTTEKDAMNLPESTAARAGTRRRRIVLAQNRRANRKRGATAGVDRRRCVWPNGIDRQPVHVRNQQIAGCDNRGATSVIPNCVTNGYRTGSAGRAGIDNPKAARARLDRWPADC